jgi:hypothetical protein
MIRLPLFLIIFFGPFVSCCQNFDGFVITQDDSLIRGYMRILKGDHRGSKILITPDKRTVPRMFYSLELKRYVYRKDTIAILENFYPFDEEQYSISKIEAKAIVRTGRLKLYEAILPEYKPTVGVYIIPTGGAVPVMGAYYYQTGFQTYLVKMEDGSIHGIKKRKKDFIECMEYILSGNPALMALISKGQLRFKDTPEIIRRHNKY